MLNAGPELFPREEISKVNKMEISSYSDVKELSETPVDPKTATEFRALERFFKDRETGSSDTEQNRRIDALAAQVADQTDINRRQEEKLKAQDELIDHLQSGLEWKIYAQLPEVAAMARNGAVNYDPSNIGKPFLRGERGWELGVDYSMV